MSCGLNVLLVKERYDPPGQLFDGPVEQVPPAQAHQVHQPVAVHVRGAELRIAEVQGQPVVHQARLVGLGGEVPRLGGLVPDGLPELPLAAGDPAQVQPMYT